MQALQRPIFSRKNLKSAYIPQEGASTTGIFLMGKAGSMYESMNEIGVAHLVEHLLANANKELASISKLGIKSYGILGRSFALYGIVTLNEYLDPAVRYLAECFKRNTFSTEEVADQRRLAISEIKQRIGIPEKYITGMAYRNLFTNRREQHFSIGLPEDVKKLDLNKVKHFKQRAYTSDNFVICGSGPVANNDILLELVQKHFPTRINTKRMTPLKLVRNQKLVIKCHRYPYSPLTHLRVDYHGYNKSQPRQFAQMALGKLLDLRLKEVLLCNVYTVKAISVSAGKYGILGAYAAVEPKDLLKTLETVKATIDNLGENLNKETVEILKQQLVSEFVIGLETPASKARYQAYLMLYGKDDQTYVDDLQKIKHLSKKDLVEEAQKLLNQTPKITTLSPNNNEKEVETQIRAAYY
jgi:predicted Zn-dependent peptidase